MVFFSLLNKEICECHRSYSEIFERVIVISLSVCVFRSPLHPAGNPSGQVSGPLVSVSLLTKGLPGDSVVKNPPAIQETWVLSLGGEDPLGEEMATHSSILAWEIPQGSLVGYSPWGHKESDTTERLNSSSS